MTSRGSMCRPSSSGSTGTRPPAGSSSGRSRPCRGGARRRLRSRSAGDRASRCSRGGSRAPPSGGRQSGRSPRSELSLATLEQESGIGAEALHRCTVECHAIVLGGLFVQRRRVSLANVEEALRNLVDDELVVAVPLLGLLARRPRPGRIGLRRFLEERSL